MEVFLNILTYIGYILAALMCLMFMIVIHEAGHYAVAKMLGFTVNEFSIGFGPAIFKRKNKKSGEIFAIRCLPLGGYCAFYGEEGEEENKKIKSDNNEVFDEIKDEKSSEVALENQDIITSEETAVANKKIPFNDQAPWKRILVFIAGALANYFSAVLLIAIFFMAYGEYVPKIVNVHELNSGVEQNFMVGDEIIRIDGKNIYSCLNPNHYAELLQKAEDVTNVEVVRDGKLITIEVHRGRFVTTDEKGNYVAMNGFGITTDVSKFARYKYNFFEAIGKAFVFSIKIIVFLFEILGQLFTGGLGVKGTLGGPVTTITTIAAVSRMGFEAVLYAVCTMSATLAIMNLLPFPALDGSKVVFTAIEWVRGKPINQKVENTIHLVGLILLFTLTIVLDIINMI